MQTEILRLLAGKRPTGVVHIWNPPIDKVVAHVIAERYAKRRLPVRGYWRKPHCQDGMIDKWLRRGVIPIDVGRLKYHGRSPSAAGFMSWQLELAPSPGQRKLLAIIRENNQTGFLKNAKMSIPWMLRVGFEFKVDQIDHHEWVERTKDVLNSWLLVNDGEGIAGRGLFLAKQNFPDLFARTSECGDTPLTIREYLVNLAALPEVVPAENVIELVTWWINRWETFRRLRESANAAVETMAAHLSTFKAGEFTGCLVHTDSVFLVKALARKFSLVVSRSHRGRVAILARNLDISATAEHLQARNGGKERRRWHSMPGAVVNGTPMYASTRKTALSDQQLIEILQRFPPRRPQPPARSGKERQAIRASRRSAATTNDN